MRRQAFQAPLLPSKAYNEWLKVFIGKRSHSDYNLDLERMSVYDKKLDPSIRNEAVTASLR